jgi:hypothetical protein
MKDLYFERVKTSKASICRTGKWTTKQQGLTLRESANGRQSSRAVLWRKLQMEEKMTGQEIERICIWRTKQRGRKIREELN